MLVSLRVAVDSAPSALERNEAQAKLGNLLVQLGQFDEAEFILTGLRRELSVDHHPIINLRIIILEALIAYYQRLDHLALDRIRRAFTLAAALSANELAAEAAVWFAHIAFNFESYADLRRALEFALSHQEQLDSSHKARLCLVVADAFQFLGDRVRSQNWYTIARVLSRRVHDHGLMAAIEYNRLVIGLSRVRVERARKENSIADCLRNWEAELLSVERLIGGFGGDSLSKVMDWSDSFVCQLRGDYAGAVHAMNRIENAKAIEQCGMTATLFEIERVWCLTHVQASIPSDSLNFLSLDVVGDLSLNDQLLALPMLWDIYATMRMPFAKDIYLEMWTRADEYYIKTINDMIAGVSPASDLWQQTLLDQLTRN